MRHANIRVRKANLPETVHPLLQQALIVLANSDKPLAYICRKSGVSRSAIIRWQRGEIRSPQVRTIDAALRAVGFGLGITERRRG